MTFESGTLDGKGRMEDLIVTKIPEFFLHFTPYVVFRVNSPSRMRARAALALCAPSGGRSLEIQQPQSTFSTNIILNS